MLLRSQRRRASPQTSALALWWMRPCSVAAAWAEYRMNSARTLRQVALCSRAVAEVVGGWSDRPALLATSLTPSAPCAGCWPPLFLRSITLFVACQQRQFPTGNLLRWCCSCSCWSVLSMSCTAASATLLTPSARCADRWSVPV